MSHCILTTQKTVLVGAILMCISPTYAQQSDPEVQQLRQEVHELRALLEATIQQSKAEQSTPLQVVKPVQATVSPKVSKSFVTSSGTEVNFYGWVRADASYQKHGASDISNSISSVPLNNTSQDVQQRDLLRTTANTSRFGFNFQSPTEVGNVGGKFEMDFFGGASHDQFRIRHAYLTFDHWLIGQTWSNFIVPEYLPETVDGAPFVGGSVLRNPVIRYTDNLSTNANYVISLEDPKYTTGSDPDSKMRLPALIGRINYKFADGSVISGRLATAEKKTTDDSLIAWGIGLGGKYQFTPTTTIKADYYHVKGDGRLLLWTNAGYTIDKENHNQIYANEFDSITLGVTQKFTPKFRSTLGLGYMLANDRSKFALLQHDNPTQNKEIWQGWINALYNPYKPITLGVEYVYGERTTFNDRQGIDNRVNLMASYDF